MNRLYVILFIISSQAQSAIVLSERTWCTGIAHRCKIEKSVVQGPVMFGDVSKAYTDLVTQHGYQGIPVQIGASHLFYVYNALGGVPYNYTFRTKLCDMNNNCVNYEKKIRLGWKEYYGETLYSSLEVFSDKIGREPIFADTEISGPQGAHDYKEASLLFDPFPYD